MYFYYQLQLWFILDKKRYVIFINKTFFLVSIFSVANLSVAKETVDQNEEIKGNLKDTKQNLNLNRKLKSMKSDENFPFNNQTPVGSVSQDSAPVKAESKNPKNDK